MKKLITDRLNKYKSELKDMTNIKLKKKLDLETIKSHKKVIKELEYIKNKL